MSLWTPSREEGLRRLEAFLPHAGRDYARLRNYDLGPGQHQHVSTLSPWIRHRLIFEEEVVAAVLARHSFSAADKFIQEVFWRTYWKGWLELRPGIWSAYRRQLDGLVEEMDRDPGLRERWEEATAGRTGIECFDAWSRELADTGYLHNHARMWFASIWIFTLQLPWELGADFFLRHLLDGDPASNTLSWRWVAGLQTRGKTYLARPDNIAKFTGGRFKPRGMLSTKAAPLEGPPVPAPAAAPRSDPWDRSLPCGLLLTEEDLNPDFLLEWDCNWRGLAVMRVTERRSPLSVAPIVNAFVQGAIKDASDRLCDKLHKPADFCDGADAVESVVRWAQREGLRQIVTAYAPVGPTAEALQALSETLSGHGIALVAVLRRWDEVSWPHATRGFFPFREKIPMILRQTQTSREAAA